MNDIHVGQLVLFYLDHHPHSRGQGIIQNIDNNMVLVELTTECKEFAVGTTIVVMVDEIVG